MDHIQDILSTHQPRPIGFDQAYAVFLPLIKEAEGWSLLYQVRGQAISQAGDVAFPGGKVEAGETAVEAAVRECMEELNIDRKQIDLWGELDYLVQDHRLINAFVGQLHIEKWQDLSPNDEVAELFVVPLTWLGDHPPQLKELAIQIDEKGSRDFPFERIAGGKTYPFPKRLIPFYPEFSGQTIWGLTANLTDQLIKVLDLKSQR